MRLSGWRLPLERLSATSLSTFTSCPEQFRRKYLLNMTETQYGDRFVGGVMHDAIKLMYDQEFITQETIDSTPDRAIAKAWSEKLEEDGEPVWMDDDPHEMYRRSLQMLKTYWPIACKDEVVAVEQRFEENIAGVNVVGYIDRELRDRIKEVKTSSKKDKKPKPRWTLQGRLYSLVKDKPIEWNIITRQVTPQVVTPEEAPDLYVPAYNRDQTVQIIRFAVERMNDLYARYGKDEPWPTDGIYGDWTCGYCSFKKGCPAW